MGKLNMYPTISDIEKTYAVQNYVVEQPKAELAKEEPKQEPIKEEPKSELKQEEPKSELQQEELFIELEVPIFMEEEKPKEKQEDSKDQEIEQLRFKLAQLEESIKQLPQQVIIEKHMIETPIEIIKENSLQCKCEKFDDSELQSGQLFLDIKVERLEDDIKVLKILQVEARKEFKKEMFKQALIYSAINIIISYLLTVLV